MNDQPDVDVLKTEDGTFRIGFGGFKRLASISSVFVDAPTFLSHGRDWHLRVYPCGTDTDNLGYVNITLCGFRESPGGCARLDPTLYAIGPAGEKMIFPLIKRDDLRGSAIGWTTPPRMLEEETTYPLLQGEKFVLQVVLGPDLRARDEDRQSASSPFVLKNPSSDLILKQFGNVETSDVAFVIEKEKATQSRRKRAKTDRETFYAHRFVLEVCAPRLLEACASSGANKKAPVQIENVDAIVFEELLRYLYGGKLDDFWLEHYAKEIVDAADRFGIAEARLVATTEIDSDNVVEWLVFAHDKNCALLKEAAMDFLTKDESAMETESFDDVPGHLVKDLLAAVHAGRGMRVNASRKKLYEKGLDIGGSRESMVALLRESEEE
ncbi:LOW QUALITY PROTEIN: hypothetical protein ACHAWF_001100 [Thalassiosira exigua]